MLPYTNFMKKNTFDKLSSREKKYKANHNGSSIPRKIDLKRLTDSLLKDINAVEYSDINQREKTSKYKSLAQKFKNALYNDRRKYKGKNLENRISLKTYANYLSRTRKLFDDRLHHSFFKKINKLTINYPTYEPLFKSWHNKTASTIRIELLELKTKLKNCILLLEKYNPSSKNDLLKKTYPEWKASINNKTIEKEARIARLLLNDLNKLKVNHEIMYHLTLDSTEKSAIKMKTDESLNKKKRNTISINYPEYINQLNQIINLPDETFSGSKRSSIANLSFALAAVSGRRMIEILSTGRVKRISKYKIAFTGQAKKRTQTTDTERQIYTLVDSRLFINKLKLLRNSPALSDLEHILNKNLDDPTKTNNIKINNVFDTPLNNFAKQFFNDKQRVFKDTRAIYARIVYEKYFTRDKRWKNIDEDVFFAEILGHDDEQTQLHYKQFKLKEFKPNFLPKIQENTKLKALQLLDNDMPKLARQNAAVKIHDWVKQQVSTNPNINITTYSIRKAIPVKPTVVARYLEHVADALKLVKQHGRYEKVHNNNIIVTDDNHNISTQNIIDNQKPNFNTQKLINNQWLVQYIYQGKAYVWTGNADNAQQAIHCAWTEHNYH
jgi:hypothetical protein